MATFTEEILNEKLHFLCSASKVLKQSKFVRALDINDTDYNILTKLFVVVFQTLDTAISADIAPASPTK